MELILEMQQIVKTFPSLIANDAIDFSVATGEVHTLLGENGAGKSTLMNILSGLYAADSGQIIFMGKPVNIRSPRTAVELGIGMVHQHFMLIQAMDVIDNIILGTKSPRYPLLDRKRAAGEIAEIGEKYGLDICPTAAIEELSVGEQQRVEIIKSLYHGADLLILDEPTAVLTPEECSGLFRVIRRLTSEGKTIIFISHKLKEVMEISDRITILRKGKYVATLQQAETNKEELAQLMVGEKLSEQRIDKRIPLREPVFSLHHITAKKSSPPIASIDLTVHGGEIVGIAGVDGNGQSELALIASGMSAPESGEVRIAGEAISRINAESFFRRQVAHIPEDRNKFGLIGEMSIEENLFLKNIADPPASRLRGWKINHRYIRNRSRQLKQGFDIRAASMEEQAGNLSGGNQQKVILARELSHDPRFLIAVHPTRGLDIGAANFVHTELIRMRDAGCGILLISADLDEILLLSTTISVMYEGKLSEFLSGIDPDVERIGQLMAGHVREGYCAEA